jgi:hypothetical protein
MTEPAPGAGSDPSMLRTTAARCDEGWRLDGRKWFITGAEGAALAICMARTSQAIDRDQGATMFLVETSNPGFVIERVIDAMDRSFAGGHAEVVLDDCRVPASAVIGEVGLGYRYAQVRLGPARLTHCMRWLGVARRALDMRAGRTEPPGMAEEVRPALERLERRAGKRLGDASEPCSCRSARARASRCRGCSTRALRHRPHVEGTPGDKLAVQ